MSAPSLWVPLRVHSQYSILDASSSAKEIAKKAAKNGFSHVALTDHANLYGAVEFYKECKDQKIAAIIGCDFYEAPLERGLKKMDPTGRAAFSLVLLAKDNKGYRNLCKLSSLGFLEGFYYYPRIDREAIKEYKEGLICLVGGMDSRLAYEFFQGTPESFKAAALWYLELFGENLFFEVQRHRMREEDIANDGLREEAWVLKQHLDFVDRQERLNKAIVELAKELNVPVVATNDSHYMERADWKAHEILINIQSGEPCEIWERDSLGNPKWRVPNPKRKTYPSHEFYFKSQEEMAALFSDMPEVLQNTLEVAKRCKVEIDLKTKHYPVYLPPALEGKSPTDEERAKEVEKFLWDLCREGIKSRYTEERLAKVAEVYPGKDPLQVVEDRLKLEMSIIAPKGMCDYLLIVWDFINWAKRNGIPVGPGRGSGAGSIVLYLIGITDIEPLRFHLFFERFINPERISYPDIDVDICMDRRDEVIQYTLHKYGKENVAQIITFGTMKAKMVIKDVGRVLSVPLQKVNEIAKLIPEDIGITLEGALEKDPELAKLCEEDEEAGRILDIGRKLEGSIRNTGIHAAGLIISGEPLTEYIPVCMSKDTDMPVTQFSMKPVEQVGMLKIDFLGLKTLTAIVHTVDSIKESRGIDIDWVNLPLEDKPTFDLLNQGKTLGIFQLESGGMQDLARQLHLDKFEEIIAVGALYRPGPMDMIPSFINRKHGREPIEYDHDWMKDILAETYGIMVYQEQVMQIAQKLASYSLGEGDVLRRAMGKKDRDEMTKQREKFKQGALKNDIAEDVAMGIFDKMEKFASYGFNKSHAAAYGYLSYATAYFKANYPREWMASLLTCDSDDISKVAKFIGECQSMHIPLLPPDINEAGKTFAATSSAIRFAMNGIKGVGEGAVLSIIEERKKRGPYKSLYDFIKRIDKRTVGKKVIEHLVEAGAFDFTRWSRDELKASIENMFEAALSEEKDDKSGIMTFFTIMGETKEKQFEKPPKVLAHSSPLDRLFREKELLGFFLSGHPLDLYRDFLTQLSCVPLDKIEELDPDSVIRTAFLVEEADVRISKSQKKFAILKISDGLMHYEVPVWSDLYEEKHMLLKKNQLLYAVLHIEKNDGALKIGCRWLDDLTKADESMVSRCDQAFDKAKQFIKNLKQRQAAEAGKPKKEGTPAKVKEKEPPKVKSIKISFEAKKARLSDILKIKETFAAFRGDTPVVIQFFSGDKNLAKIDIDSTWGVSPSTALTSALKKVAPVFKVEEEKA